MGNQRAAGCIETRMLTSDCSNGGGISRDAIVAIELEVVKGCGDAVPTRHVGGLDAAHFCDSDGDDVAATERTADKDDFQFDSGIEFDAFWTKEKDAGRADVARDKRDRISFRDIFYAAQPQRQVQRSAWIFTLLMKHADSVRRDARKAANGDGTRRTQRNDFQRGSSNRSGSDRRQSVSHCTGFHVLRERRFRFLIRQSNPVCCFHLDPRDA